MSEEEENVREKYSKAEDFTNYVCTDEYGFISKCFQNKNEVFTGIKQQWYNLIDECEFDIKKFKSAILKNHLLEKGIPLSLKHRVWKDLLYVKNDINYEMLVKERSPFEYQIHVDIQRTFRHHFLFCSKYGKGQSELFNILVAYANYNKKVGYCQGMSDICAVFLMYFCERDAFDMFVSLIEKNMLEGLFDGRLSKLPEMIKAQNIVFSVAIPEIYNHLADQNIDFSIYGIGWYLTLFSRFNIKLVLRIWDFLMFYGFNILMYFAAAILKYFKKELVETKKDKLLEFMSKIDTLNVDPDLIVLYALDFMKIFDINENKFI